jgi:hypothetical protein
MKNTQHVSYKARAHQFWDQQALDAVRKDLLDNVNTAQEWYEFLQANENYVQANHASSSYPLDWSKIDHPINLSEFIYQKIGEVKNFDWDSFIKKLEEDIEGVNSYNSKVCRTRVENFSHELQFLQSMGFDKEGHVIDPTRDRYPEVFELIDNFNFYYFKPQIRIQFPGSVQEAHTDALDCFWGDIDDHVPGIKQLPFDPVTKTPNGHWAIRLIIPVYDWIPGQVFAFEDHMWSGWKAGEIITFDWANLMHYTANSSFKPRAIIKVTGITDDPNNWIFDAINNGTEKQI